MTVPARVRRAAVVLLAVALVGVLPSCSRNATTNSGQYVTGDGLITVVDPADREEAPDIAGTTLDGERIQLSQYEGKTLVVNVWGSWCPPCRKEAPALIQVSKQYADQDVQFVGIAIREESTASKAFSDRVGMPYPSISDPSSQTLLGFADSLPSQAIPTTWVIDDQGRVAARVLDDVTASTLSGLIDEVKSGDVRQSDG
ncbi:TlpA family protein disulfide reductase [Solicola sp. PLA-1-18]|uniref:TlpA family protein disulfide reductase n=1 Tax=Solicola sp. PLA-1-18 TaxID=3380532 RepID=UPI003B811D52